jgi:AAA domain
VVGANGYVIGERGELRRERRVGDQIQLCFSAGNIRPERTGLHARISIAANGTVLAYDTFNVERDGERTRLANSAYAKLVGGRRRPERMDYPQTYLQDDVDQFCSGLREAYLAELMPRPMPGSKERCGPRFVLEPYILVDGGTIIFAPPGFGKSTVLQTIGICIDAGCDALWPVRQTSVLLVNLERSAQSVAQRLGNINEALGLERERPLAVLNARGKTLREVAPAIQKHVDRHGTGCVLVDSLSRAGPGSLKEDDIVNGYCDILNGFGPAWCALAHSPRGDETHIFGSQMFDAAADLTVRLMSEEKLLGPMGIALDVIKRNDVGTQPLWVGAFEFDRAGLVSIRRARAGEYRQLEGKQKLSMEDAVARYLEREGASSATDIAEELGCDRGNVSRLLNASKRFVFVREEGKRVLFGVRAAHSYESKSRDTRTTREEPEELPF